MSDAKQSSSAAACVSFFLFFLGCVVEKKNWREEKDVYFSVVVGAAKRAE